MKRQEKPRNEEDLEHVRTKAMEKKWIKIKYFCKFIANTLVSKLTNKRMIFDFVFKLVFAGCK